MNKKSARNIIFYLVVGGIVGLVLSMGFFALDQTGTLWAMTSLFSFLGARSLYVLLFLFLVLFLPSAYLFFQGKSLYKTLDDFNDDESLYDTTLQRAHRYMNLALTLNSVFMVLNFLTFGTTYDQASDQLMGVMVVFMINIGAIVFLELSVVKAMQTFDSRLKGDPTSLKFTEEFIESCDEAEKEKIYQSGYHAYQLSKNTALGCIVLTMIGHMILGTGTVPILMSCLWMLQNVLAYGYYSVKLQ